jgi:hypothetical protein
LPAENQKVSHFNRERCYQRSSILSAENQQVLHLNNDSRTLPAKNQYLAITVNNNKSTFPMKKQHVASGKAVSITLKQS